MTTPTDQSRVTKEEAERLLAQMPAVGKPPAYIIERFCSAIIALTDDIAAQAARIAELESEIARREAANEEVGAAIAQMRHAAPPGDVGKLIERLRKIASIPGMEQPNTAAEAADALARAYAPVSDEELVERIVVVAQNAMSDLRVDIDLEILGTGPASYAIARAVLSAIAPALMQRGAEEERRKWREQTFSKYNPNQAADDAQWGTVESGEIVGEGK